MSHRRRGVGVARSGATRKQAQKKADEMKAISLQNALDTVEQLETKLTEFAKKHQTEIQNDPVFRDRYGIGRTESYEWSTRNGLVFVLLHHCLVLTVNIIL